MKKIRKSIQKPFNQKELINELKKEFERLGSLQLINYDKNRQDYLPSSHIVRKKLGDISWNEVLILCGYESQYNEWSKDKIIQVAKSKNKQLKFYELLELGLTRGTITQYFGNFENLYKTLEWEYEEKKFYENVKNEDLLKEYDNLCKDTGKVATSRDIQELSIYPFELFRTRFGTLNEVRKLTGYKHKTDPRTITKEQCMNEMLNLYEKRGRLSYSELKKSLTFSIRTLLRKFGTTSILDVWREVIEESEKRSKN